MDGRNFHRVSGQDAEIARMLAAAPSPGIPVQKLVQMCGSLQQYAKLMAQLKNLVDVKRLAAGYPEIYQGEDVHADTHNGRPIIWDGIFKYADKQLQFVSTTDGSSIVVTDEDYVQWIIEEEELKCVIR